MFDIYFKNVKLVFSFIGSINDHCSHYPKCYYIYLFVLLMK